VLALEWSSQARDDLSDILDYVEQHNPLAANKLHETIAGCAERLPSMPFAFRAGRVAGTREYPVHPNYLLIYKVDAVRVQILRVLHARRRYPA